MRYLVAACLLGPQSFAAAGAAPEAFEATVLPGDQGMLEAAAA